MNINEALLGWNYFNAPPPPSYFWNQRHHYESYYRFISVLYSYCVPKIGESGASLWARFINSLHQSKPSFDLKNLLLGFTKNVQWKGVDTVILLLTLLLMHLLEFSFQMLHLWEIFKWITQHYIYIYAFRRRFYPKRLPVHSGYTFIVSMLLLFTKVCTSQFPGVCTINIYHPKKAWLNQLVPVLVDYTHLIIALLVCTALGRLRWSLWKCTGYF